MLRTIAVLIASVAPLVSTSPLEPVCKSVTKVKVLARDTVVVLCDEVWPFPQALTGPLILADLDAAPSGVPLSQYPALKTVDTGMPCYRAGGSAFWLGVRLAAGKSLEKNSEYVLRVRLSDNSRSTTVIAVSTIPKATITSTANAQEAGHVFLIDSDVMLDRKQVEANGRLAEVLADKTSKPLSNDPKRPPEVLGDERQLTAIGSARVELKDRLRRSEIELKAEGIEDIFAQPVPAQAKVTLGNAPKAKEDASQYYKLAHVASRDSRPSWAADLKFNQFVRWLPPALGLFLRPDLQVDIGLNNTNVTNQIKLGISGTKTISREGGVLPLHSWIPGVYWEADRDLKKNNSYLSLDWQPFFTGLYRPKEAREARLKAAGKTGKPLYGYGLNLFLGVEAGGSPRAYRVENEDRTESVSVDNHYILRPRPRMQGFAEFSVGKRQAPWLDIVLNATTALRYLLADELVGDKKPLRLRTVNGFQPYSEFTVSFASPKNKNVSFDVTYKYGPQPPLFSELKTVTSGLAFKY